MSVLHVDFHSAAGKIKPMHAVNNGPVKDGIDQTRGNFHTFSAAGIPFVRNHDASFCSGYGGEHTVDILAIFPDFDADVNDPASYDFTLTDEYTETILETGAKVFYRLGSKIEHWKKKYGTLPPKDFQKWAEICEHIIRHYNEGWADGFHWNIEYWEIWNEPDLDPDDSLNKRTWGGTKVQFFDLYRTAAIHLKKCFPQLKIGGPAIAGNMTWAEDFLTDMAANNIPLDFFSWHIYTPNPHALVEKARDIRALLDRFGYRSTESILNEWNYILNWDTRFVESIQTISALKGAAFTAACMLGAQQDSIDLLMYYDARIDTCFNGLFDLYTLRPIKGYYPFPMFHALYKAGTACKSTTDDPDLYIAAAKDADGKTYVMVTYYTNEIAEAKTAVLDFIGGAEQYELLLLDDEKNMESAGIFRPGDDLTLQPNTVALLQSI